MTDAYIYDAIRTPRGKGKPDGTLHQVPAVRLSALMLNALARRNNLEGHAVEDVIWGNVTQVGEQGGCLARSAVLYSDLDERIPGVSHQPLLRLGAGSREHGRQPGARRRGRGLHRRRRREHEPRADGLRRRRHRRRPLPRDESLFRAAGHLAPTSSPPSSASRATTPTRWRSKASTAPRWPTDEGRFTSIVPVTDINGLPILDHDEMIRETDMQALGALNPSFKQMGEVMPGFDAGRADEIPRAGADRAHPPRRQFLRHRRRRGGRAGRARKSSARRTGLKPRARVRATAASAPIRRSCSPARCRPPRRCWPPPAWQFGDIDLFEVNEAFASVVLRFLQLFQRRHRQGQRQRRRHRHGPPAGRHRRDHPVDPARRDGAQRQGNRPCHALHRLRHGCRHHHRAGLTHGRDRHRKSAGQNRLDLPRTLTMPQMAGRWSHPPRRSRRAHPVRRQSS